VKHELQTRTRRPNIESLPGPFLHSSAARLIVLASSSSPSSSYYYYYYYYYRSTIALPNLHRADSLPILLSSYLSLSLSLYSRVIVYYVVILCATPVEDYNNTYYYCTPALCHPVLHSRKDRLRAQRWHDKVTISDMSSFIPCRVYRYSYTYKILYGYRGEWCLAKNRHR